MLVDGNATVIPKKQQVPSILHLHPLRQPASGEHVRWLYGLHAGDIYSRL